MHIHTLNDRVRNHHNNDNNHNNNINKPPPRLTLLTRELLSSQRCHSLTRVAWHKVGGSKLWTVLSGRLGQAGSQLGVCRGSSWLWTPLCSCSDVQGGLFGSSGVLLDVRVSHKKPRADGDSGPGVGFSSFSSGVVERRSVRRRCSSRSSWFLGEL